MYNLLKSSKTATLTSTVQVLALHIYAPKIYWLVFHHVKHIISTKPSGIVNPPYIMGEPNGELAAARFIPPKYTVSDWLFFNKYSDWAFLFRLKRLLDEILTSKVD